MVTPEEGEGKAVLAVYIVPNKRCYKCCTLLTRWSAVLAIDTNAWAWPE